MRECTPGPWHIWDSKPEENSASNWHIKIGERLIPVFPYTDVRERCETEGGLADAREHMANAHLITAAPDLFNALTVLADACENMGIPVDAARAAIAKARGE